MEVVQPVLSILLRKRPGAEGARRTSALGELISPTAKLFPGGAEVPEDFNFQMVPMAGPEVG